MFNPNQSTLASCIENIVSMQKEAGINPREIVHSRQPRIRKLMRKKPTGSDLAFYSLAAGDDYPSM